MRRFAEPITGLVQTGSDSFSARAIDRLWWGIRNTCLPTSRHLPSRLLITLGAAVFRGFIKIQGAANTSQRVGQLFAGHPAYGILIKHDSLGYYWLAL